MAHSEDHLNLIIAIDLNKSVVVAGPDGKTEFEKNVERVTRLLGEIPAGSHVTVIGITGNSFGQPYILLSARVPALRKRRGNKLLRPFVFRNTFY